MSNATIHRFLGYGPVFDVPHVVWSSSNVELIFYVILGILLGHLAPPFLALLDFAKSQFVRLKLPLYWQLGLGGVIVGAISIFIPQVWGNGYSVVSHILQGQVAPLMLLAILLAKVVATLRPWAQEASAVSSRLHSSSVRPWAGWSGACCTA